MKAITEKLCDGCCESDDQGLAWHGATRNGP
jgi:hypothetical protein